MAAQHWSVALGAASGFIGVALGAFGAHGLKYRLTAEMLAVWKTAVEYQLVHALALLLVGILMAQRASSALGASALGFAVGSLLFSGSLYVLALGGPRWIGAITPLGGLSFLVGWALLCWAAIKQ